MADHQRNVVLFLVGAVALAPHLVMAAELAVVGVEDDDGVPVHLVVFERLQHMHDLLVAVADAVEVIVAQHMPAAVLVRPLADHHVLDRLIDRMRLRAPGRVERLAAARRQRNIVPARLIEIVFGRRKDRDRGVLALHDLTGKVRVDVHDVVRIDEIDRHEPRLALRPQRLAVAAQPARDAVGGEAVIGVAAESAVDQVADAEEVVEAIALDDLAILRHGRVDRDPASGRDWRSGATCPDRSRGSRDPACDGRSS